MNTTSLFVGAWLHEQTAMRYFSSAWHLESLNPLKILQANITCLVWYGMHNLIPLWGMMLREDTFSTVAYFYLQYVTKTIINILITWAITSAVRTHFRYEGFVSKQTEVLCWWESERWKFGINQVDKSQITMHHKMIRKLTFQALALRHSLWLLL